jgi:hypothetical protein
MDTKPKKPDKLKKKQRIFKLRSAIKPTREHGDKTKYSRKGKWAKRHGQ